MRPRPVFLKEDNPFLEMITDDLLETSVAVANRWKEEFGVSENQKDQRFGVYPIRKKEWIILPFFGSPYGKP